MPPDPAATDLQARLDAAARSGPDAAVAAVDLALAEAVRRAASDVHFEPTPDALAVRLRIDGVLGTAATLPRALAPNVVARLKVLADLLTYRVDVPQEGRVREPPGSTRGDVAEMRVSTFPT